MRVKLSLLVSGILISIGLCGQTISLLTKDPGLFGLQALVYDSTGTNLLEIGNYVQIGFFDTSAAASVGEYFGPINSDFAVTSNELSSLFEDWTPFTTDTVAGGQIGDFTEGASAGPGTFAIAYGGVTTAGTFFENKKAFLTIYKTFDGTNDLGTNWSNVTEIGIFSDTSWSFLSVGNNPGEVIDFYTSDVTEFLVGSQGSLVLAAVPEPATYALVFGIFSLGIVFWRRRRRQ